MKASDVVITMGCGDSCPHYPGKRYEDCVVLDDPAGKGLDMVRGVRDQIRGRVESLLHDRGWKEGWGTHPLRQLRRVYR